MNLSVDEMLELALKVYQGRDWKLNGNGDPAYSVPSVNWPGEFRTVVFKPKLDGTDEQKSQALDCIVAAENSPQHQQYRDHVANGMPSFQAAISALLAKEQS